MLHKLRLVEMMRSQSEADSRAVAFSALGAGLTQGLVLVTLGQAMDHIAKGQLSLRLFLLFLVCVFGYFFLFRRAMHLATDLSLGALTEKKAQMVRKLARVRLADYEKMDRDEVVRLLGEQKEVAIEVSRLLPAILSDMILVFFASLYTLYISTTGFLLVAGVMAVGGLFLLGVHRGMAGHFGLVAAAESRVGRALTDLLDGFTELKVRAGARRELTGEVIAGRLDDLRRARMDLEALNVKGMSFFSFFLFLPCGALLFILPAFAHMPMPELFKLFAAAMFSISPMMGFIRFYPIISKCEASLRAMDDFERGLEDMAEAQADDAPQRGPAGGLPDGFRRIQVRDLAFHYSTEGGAPAFGIRVQDFHLERGELVIMCGGNGSGKTTFMKTLAGLYEPQAGTLSVDGVNVAELGLENYRSLFSVIFADFHLFERFYGGRPPDSARARALLRDLRLEHKVDYADGAFSTRDLSSGQKKRLALAAALLDERPVLLLDEVAADFDPEFRVHFYREFLPRLKAEGRTVMAISHDDRFFDVGDRVVRMREGAIVDNGEAGWSGA